MGNTLAQLGSALALGVALAGAPNTASAQVSEATRAKVIELQKDPAFKLKGSAKKCMTGELVDSNCDEMVQLGIKNHLQNIELTKLQEEKGRLDAEKSRLDRSIEIIGNENQISSHVGSAIFMVDLMNIALFNAPENSFRTEYIKEMRVTPDVAKYIERILQKIDKKQPLNKADISEFNTLFQKHTELAKKMIAETKEWKNRDVINYLDRILTAYATIKPKIEAKIG